MSVSPLTEVTERYSEKYAKKLIRRTDSDLEDALERLGKLIFDEARMATTERLRMTQPTADKINRSSHPSILSLFYC